MTAGGGARKARESSIASQSRTLFQWDSHSRDQMGGRFLIDHIDLVEDGILNDLLEKRLRDRGECRGICSGQTLFVSTHVTDIPHRAESDGLNLRRYMAKASRNAFDVIQWRGVL